MTPTRTAREVVELYNLVVFNNRDFAVAEELIGDTVTRRHEVGKAPVLTHGQSWRPFASLPGESPRSGIMVSSKEFGIKRSGA